MDLQAIRYAAMISTLTFDKLVGIYQEHLRRNGSDRDATEALLEFLGWREPEDEPFGQEVKIVLAAADFSKELTTSVMWLNEFGLDVRCVRMHPYVDGGQIFLDVQTVIPLPEVADYQVAVREKKQKEREARESARDYTKYDVRVAGEFYPAENKRGMMFRLISAVLANQGTPTQVMEAIPGRGRTLFRELKGSLDAAEAYEQIMESDKGGSIPKAKRYFCDDGQVFHADGKTYVLTNQWGKDAPAAADLLARAFPQMEIEVKPA